MIKTCVVLNGKLINIGEWDYQIQKEIQEDGTIENKVTNPMPEGATMHEINVEYDDIKGWYAPEFTEPVIDNEKRIKDLEMAILALMGGDF